MNKIVITLEGNDIAPRFDLCTEVWVGMIDTRGDVQEEDLLVLSHASAEELCQLIVSNGIHKVVCGGIENEYFDYLRWKKIAVYDSVIGSYRKAMQELISGRLRSGAILAKDGDEGQESSELSDQADR
jgi:predicted Fe-Mo cluster-binding NifX family protein